MKLITWNVNSLRTRLDRVLGLLDRHRPDVLCLQETKMVDADFPRTELESKGYHCAFWGQRAYNGVAVLSRESPQQVEASFDGNPVPDAARVLGVTVDGWRIINLYVVNGQSIDSDKYALKLNWLEVFARWLHARHDPTQPLILAGDFNIAPSDRDVYDPTVWKGKLLCSEPERKWLCGLQQWGLADLLRVNEADKQVFSWWDYRYGAFARNLGLRIDLILATQPVASRCTSVVVDRDERKAKSGPGKPSDHAPVIATFEHP